MFFHTLADLNLQNIAVISAIYPTNRRNLIVLTLANGFRSFETYGRTAASITGYNYLSLSVTVTEFLLHIGHITAISQGCLSLTPLLEVIP